MKARALLIPLLATVISSFAQTPSGSDAEPQNDPRILLATVAHSYDFNSPDLKPWHLKASYQFFDDHGNPSDQGVYEFWWVSPKVHRSTWKRGDAEHAEWSVADGTLYRKDTGAPLRYFERTPSGPIRHVVLNTWPGHRASDSKNVPV